MSSIHYQLRLECITGLEEVVHAEINQRFPFSLGVSTDDTGVYVDPSAEFSTIEALRSIWRAYLVVQDLRFTPYYISNHKSILGELIETILKKSNHQFLTFHISCAGSDSREVRSIARYISDAFGVTESQDADLKIHIAKRSGMWEVGAQITPRPLSRRTYRVRNMEGAMDATIAYAMNFTCDLSTAHSYLNCFSGSSTLLIEAKLSAPHLEPVTGIENTKTNLLYAVENIKAAGLVKQIKLEEADVCGFPKIGNFDVVTADLPFGMLVGKGADLRYVYGCFIKYSERVLNAGGCMAAYTNERALFEELIRSSSFSIKRKIPLEFMTNSGDTITPSIYLCTLDEQPKA